MDRPFHHSRCHPGGTARATLGVQTPYWRNPSFPATSYPFAASIPAEHSRCERRGARRLWGHRRGDRQDTSRAVECMGTTRLIHEPLHTSGRRFLARGPWRTFLLIIWLLLLHTLRFDTERYAERWRGPTHRPPGSPWPHRHQPRAGGTAREGDC